MRAKTELLAAGAIFVVAYSIFLISPVRRVADSNYSMLLSQSLLDYRSFALDHYVIPGFNSSSSRNGAPNRRPYQLQMKSGHIYYYYPAGTSVLSVPYVALMNLFGLSPANAAGVFSSRDERRIQTYLASLLMAILAVVFFSMSRLLLPLGWSLLIAFGAAFGTQVWSTASRALWSDTWGIFLLGFVVWMLFAHETKGRRIQPVLLASLLAWSYFVRPTYCVPIVAVTVYLIIFYPSLAVQYIVTGAAWLCVFVAYSWYHFGRLLPDYYQANQLTFDRFWEAMAGSLVSPSRGLLIFVPVIGFVFYLLARYAREVTCRRLVALCFGIIAAHLIAVAGFPSWWAGHSYGPRYTTGLLPWFVVLSILAVKAKLAWREKRATGESPWNWNLERLAGGVLLAASVAIHANGAINQRALRWNETPVDVDEHPERVWDWRDPQFLVK